MNGRELIEWLNDHPLLSLHALEKKAGVPQGTLHKALSGERSLPDKYLPELTRILSSYGLNEETRE